MGLVVTSNNISLNTSRHLASANTHLEQSLERLSSGFRINSAADDAAGLQISNRMSSDILSSDQVIRNLNDGVSYAQVGEAALAEISAMTLRMRLLAIQSQNGILNDADRQALDKEFQALKLEINNIAQNTEIFGKHPLLPTDYYQNEITTGNPPQQFSQNSYTLLAPGFAFLQIPQGSTDINIDFNSSNNDNDLQLFTADGIHLTGTNLTGTTDITWNSHTISSVETHLFTVLNGFASGATYDDTLLNTGGHSAALGMNFNYSGDGDFNNSGYINYVLGESDEESLTIDRANTNLVVVVSTTNTPFNRSSIAMNWSSWGDHINGTALSESESDVKITTSPALNSPQHYKEIPRTPATATELGLVNLSIDTLDSAEQALLATSDAIEKVSAKRAIYGEAVNTLQTTIRNTTIRSENMNAARSQIQDTDYASEVVKLEKNQIIMRVSQSLLMQANQQPQLALTLLS